MPAAYVGAATALAGAVSSATSGGSQSPGYGGGSTTNSSSFGSNPFAGLGGGIASSLNPPQAQTSPGAYSPPSNIGEGYNYIPTGQGSIDQLIQSILSGSGGLSSGAGGGAVPGLSNFMDPSFGVGQAATGLAGTGAQTVSNANALGGSVQPALAQVMNSAGFNPGALSALYSKLLNDTQNQANVQNAQSGLGATPYGAGVANQDVQNFQMNWPLFLQSLQTGGVQNLQGLGNVAGGAAALGGVGAGQEALASTLPISSYLGLAQQQQGVNQSTLGPAQAYMNSAQGPNALSNTVALAQDQLVGNQNANAAAGISSGFQGLLGNLGGFGNGLSGLYNSIFGGTSDTNPATGNSYATDVSGTGQYGGGAYVGATEPM